MTPITWIAGGLAALVAGVAILIKGGMAEKPGGQSGGGAGTPAAAGSMAAGDAGGGGGIPLPQDPLPTQTRTGKLSNGEGWGTNDFSEPAVSYTSDGDGGGYLPVGEKTPVSEQPWSPATPWSATPTTPTRFSDPSSGRGPSGPAPVRYELPSSGRGPFGPAPHFGSGGGERYE